MKKKLSELDFLESIKDVVNSDDKVFILFSGIYSFGHKFDWPVRQTPAKLIDLLIDFCDTDKTIIFPAYCNDFPKTKKFDLHQSLTSVGSIPDQAVIKHETKRTSQPMQSYTVYGHLEEELLNYNSDTAWGKNSIMSWLVEKNTRILILGVPWHKSCSILHHAEELLHVPYRYYKRFTGEYFIDGVKIRDCYEIIYSRSLKTPPKWNHKPIKTILENKKMVMYSNNPGIPIESSNINDFVSVTLDMIDNDPYAYIDNKEEVKYWVNNVRESEINSLNFIERVNYE